MKFWQCIAWIEVEQMLEIAKFAEAAGYYGVLGGDHLFLSEASAPAYPLTADGKMNSALDVPFPDIFASVAAMAAVTTRLHFSSSVYVLPLHSPLAVAKSAATIALLSNNRFALGFGVGWQKEEYAAVGQDFHTRGKRADEMIDVMRKCWQGGVISHHGRFFDFEQIHATPVPAKPVPLYYGGMSEAALRRAAYLCDGFIGVGHRLEEIPALMAELTRLRREAGREYLPFETMIALRPVDPLPSIEALKRLEDIGVTSIYSAPFFHGGLDRGRSKTGLGQYSTLEAKKRVMAHYAETIIHRMR